MMRSCRSAAGPCRARGCSVFQEQGSLTVARAGFDFQTAQSTNRPGTPAQAAGILNGAPSLLFQVIKRAPPSPDPGASGSCLANFSAINPVPIIPRLSFPGIVLQVAGSGLFQPIFEGLNGIDNLFRVVTKNIARERFWSMRRADIMMLSLCPSVSCSHGAGLDA